MKNHKPFTDEFSEQLADAECGADAGWRAGENAPHDPLTPEMAALAERVQNGDRFQGRRFRNLSAEDREIASEGLYRHLNACEKSNVLPEPSALREIIDEAVRGNRIYDHCA